MPEYAALDPTTISGADFSAFAADPEMVAGIISEWREHLAAIEEKMLLIEKDATDLESINAVFRYVHTIKGLAGFLEIKSIQAIAHEVETLLDHVRCRRLTITPALVDSIFSGIDLIRIEIDRLQRHLSGDETPPTPSMSALLEQIRSSATQVLAAEASPTVAPSEASAAAATNPPSSAMALDGELDRGTDSVRAKDQEPVADSVAATKETDTQGSAMPGTGPRATAAKKKGTRPTAPNVDERSVRIDTSKLDHLMNMVGELVIAQTLVANNPLLASIQDQRLQSDLARLNRIAAEIQRATTSMRMVPIGTEFQKMARVVRDLSRQLGKQVVLTTSGEDTELDKTIAEGLSGPLLHMVRNSVDHGIETPEERALAGKEPTATIRLAAYHKSAQIVIEVADDGRGLDRQKIIAKAVERGLVRADKQLSDSEAFQLIFEPGFSTAERVTDVSGRGVGLDVVLRHVQKLRGRIEIQSTVGVGTTFFLKLPLTLGIIDSLVVGVGGARYILPLYSVAEIFCPTASQIQTASDLQPGEPPDRKISETVTLRGAKLPILRLHRRFQLAPRTEDLTRGLLLVSEVQGKRFCLFVDEMIGKQEVVIKNLGDTFSQVDGLMGCAILSDGKIGLIVDIETIYRPEVDAEIPSGSSDSNAPSPSSSHADWGPSSEEDTAA